MLALYTIGAIAGSLASSVFNPVANIVGCVNMGICFLKSSSVLFRASGADYALIGAHLANLIENWSTVGVALRITHVVLHRS